MSIPKAGLLRAYRQMNTIREFEERAHAEIMNGQIPGFTHLYTGSGDGLLSDALVALVEERAVEICDRWLAQVRRSPTTATYARLDLTDVRETGLEVLSRFCSWLQDPAARGTMEAFYLAIGRRRARLPRLHAPASLPTARPARPPKATPVRIRTRYTGALPPFRRGANRAGPRPWTGRKAPTPPPPARRPPARRSPGREA